MARTSGVITGCCGDGVAGTGIKGAELSTGSPSERAAPGSLGLTITGDSGNATVEWEASCAPIEAPSRLLTETQSQERQTYGFFTL